MDTYNESLGNVFQALADPTRRAVIQRLGIGPASTKELAQPFGMALPSFMQHLTFLENSGLIASKKEGRVRTWQLDHERLIAVELWVLEQRKLWEERTDRLVNYIEDWYARETNLTENKYDFTVSRLIKAPRSVVWKAWTIPEHLEKWWCPKPMTTKIVGFDLRPGGAFNLRMGDPNGAETTVIGAFLEIVPEERIVFTTALAENWRPAPTLLPITAIISIIEDSNKTRYETRVLVKNEEERQKLDAMNFEIGWSLGIDQLIELAEQG